MEKIPIQFYVDKHLKTLIEEAAEHEHMSIAGFVRYAVIEKVREIKEGPNRIS